MKRIQTKYININGENFGMCAQKNFYFLNLFQTRRRYLAIYTEF